jgi:lipoprotein NlpI
MRAKLLKVAILITLVFISPTRAADDALLREAEQAFAQDRHDQALELTNQYVAANPAVAKGYLLRAAIRAAERKWQESLGDYDRALELDPALTVVHQRRAIARFMAGRIKEACDDFDRFNQTNPDAAPQNWQRGIALYYAERYEDGAKQFELHRTVNPDDVENAAWHFACVARWKTPAAAKEGLIPIQGDTRIPMSQIHEMFAGKLKPEQVVAAAKEGNPAPAQLNRQLFYAHLYAGLYCEATGKNEEAKTHLTEAVKHEVPDYMYGVARVHVGMLEAKK